MKKFIFAIFMIAALSISNVVSAQSVVRNSNIFTATKVSKNKTEPTKTKFTWVDSKGINYPIYVSASGSCFILKTSKNTGKEYRKYLGAEVSKQICKELNIEYKSKVSK